LDSNNKCLFIFRRDLRLEDNTGLIYALKNFKTVIPCFIFTPTQIELNPFRGDPCLQVLIESLHDLEEQLEEKKAKLYLFFGNPEEIIAKCIKILQIEAVIVNRDYTPFSIARDAQIKQTCLQHNVRFHLFDDILLNPPEATLKKDGTPYTVFTPYFHNALKFTIPYPEENLHDNYYHQDIPFAEDSSIYKRILPSAKTFKGGRRQALDILKTVHKFEAYATDRDFPAIHGTTHLSAHLKFNTCSIREVYHAIAKTLSPHHELIRSLYWRDFFTSIAFHFPRVFQGPFLLKFDQVQWSQNNSHFEKWCTGQTGFPIVDAGIREMNETGWMHNRVRMITASFLIKDLHIHWQWGEKYFAQKLIDYDPAVNNGNWQWSASTGTDAQPYFRIFNPWNQQKKFDPDCIYIKKWIPELRELSPKVIHNWLHEQDAQFTTYPRPMISHEKESKITLDLYKSSTS
jgi:deoxyribodipyrimidine photo-lyase